MDVDFDARFREVSETTAEAIADYKTWASQLDDALQSLDDLKKENLPERQRSALEWVDAWARFIASADDDELEGIEAVLQNSLAPEEEAAIQYAKAHGRAVEASLNVIESCESALDDAERRVEAGLSDLRELERVAKSAVARGIANLPRAKREQLHQAARDAARWRPEHEWSPEVREAVLFASRVMAAGRARQDSDKADS